MPVTEDQGKQLALMACAGRPVGAPRWDPVGVYAAIRKVQHLPLTEVMRAVANAADDRELVTPGAIGNPTTSCWRIGDRHAVTVAGPDTWEPNDRCAECSRSRAACEAMPVHVSGHRFRSVLDHTRDADNRRINVPATVQGCKQIAAEHPTEETP